ncbi:MAG TPA: DUF1330 domain-containing protein [Stellaceae bacterium]|nr:DUF1330 domain-containing protein [Stellaceae bacterium]
MTAYLISEIDVTDPKAYEPYKTAASAAIARHGGKYIVRGGKTLSLEGAPPKRMIVLEFPDIEAAKRFHESAEYQAAIPLRKKASAGSRLYIVEGQ